MSYFASYCSENAMSTEILSSLIWVASIACQFVTKNIVWSAKFELMHNFSVLQMDRTNEIIKKEFYYGFL